LAPERGLAERLSLDVAAFPADDGAYVVPIGSLSSIATRPLDTSAAPKEGAVAVDPLAASVPHDQYAIFFPSFDDMLRVNDEWDRLGAELMAYFLGNSADRQLGPWYRRQLCVEITAVERVLGAKLIASTVLTGSDPYFDVGTDAALLFEAKSVDGLRKYFSAKQAAAKLLVPGVEDVRGTLAGVDYVGVRSPDRRICSYLFTVGNVVGVTNSLKQLERLLATMQGKAPSLSAAADYRLLRQRHPRSQETGCLVLTDAALRRWFSPIWRVGSSRRTRAAALMFEAQAETLDNLVAGRFDAAGKPLDREIAGLGKLTAHAGGVRSSIYGTLEFMTPIIELAIEGVTESETDAYRRWRSDFEERWWEFLSPGAVQLSLKGRDLSIAATMAQPSNDSFRRIVHLAGDATLDEREADGHARAIFRASSAFDAKSELWRNLGQFADLVLGISGAHRAVGDSLSINVEDSPVWRRVTAAADPAVFWSARGEALPLAVHVDARNFELNRRIMASFQRQKAALFGSRFTSEPREHRGIAYYRVQGGLFGQDMPPMYDAAGPKGMLVAMSEATLRRALDRQVEPEGNERPKTGDEKKDGLNVKRLGRHVEVRANRLAAEVLERLLSTDVERSTQARSWSNLPILSEWKRRYPEQDPVEVHRRLWYTELKCPGGGGYAWNEERRIVRSSVFGDPAEPQEVERKTNPIEEILRLGAGASFEPSMVMMRAEMHRASPEKKEKKDD
jgi:hypothetical protein